MARIAALLAAGPTFSFEFFPPKTDAAQLTLGRTIPELEPHVALASAALVALLAQLAAVKQGSAAWILVSSAVMIRQPEVSRATAREPVFVN